MYYGESSTSLDDKGRLSVPVQFRTVMDAHDHDVWYLTRGFDGAVFLFEKAAWQALPLNGRSGSPLEPRMLDFRRMFLGSVAKVKRDRQGRLTIPAHLREYAGIDREAVLLGVEDHLEVWSKENWRGFQARQAEQYKAMAAELFGTEKSAAAPTQGDLQGDEH
jgi:MraZ protein